MDPRIRRRRVEVGRDEGRRRLRLLLVGLAVVGLAVGAYGITRSPLLDVDDVVVQGTARVPHAEVVRTAGLSGRTAMVDLDGPTIARRVERLPWVEHAEVTKEWPGRVRIDVVERTPVAAVSVAAPPGQPARWVLADVSGQVLDSAPAPAAGLVQVLTTQAPGAPGSSLAPATRAAVALAASFRSPLEGRVGRIVIGANGDLELTLDDRIQVLFGSPGEADRKLVALTTLVDRVDLKTAKSIDVRVPSSPVLTRR